MLRKLLIAALLTLAALPASAVLLIKIQEVGPDLVLTATGDYDFSGATQGLSVGLGNDAVIIANSPNGYVAMGWATPNPGGTGQGFHITFSSPIVGTSGVITPSVFSATHPFYLSPVNNAITIPPGAPLVASGINNYALFPNASYADIGVSPGMMTVNWAGGDGAIVVVVPEPSTYIALAGFGALGLLVWRRRKRAAVKAAL